MFKELAPVLRDRAVLLTVTLVDADQITTRSASQKDVVDVATPWS
jgi:hypothetical protein